MLIQITERQLCMPAGTVNSVTVETGPSPDDEERINGYELLITEDGMKAPIIIERPDSDFARDRFTLVSGSHVFPSDVQSTMHPYFDNAGLAHSLNSGATNDVAVKEARALIESSKGNSYYIQQVDQDHYYVSHDGSHTTLPDDVASLAQDIFPHYTP